MKSNKLIILSLVTIAVIVAAAMMSRHRAPTTSLQKQFLFPGLLDKVNDISAVRLTKQEKSLSLAQKDRQWVIQEADNYQADFGKIRETAIAVAELKVLAEKTSNPELYKILGVEDPTAATANSLQLSLLNTQGEALARLIVGKTRHSKSSGDKPGLYVRLPDTAAALLVEGRLDLSADVTDWFKRKLFNINASRVKYIQITHADDSMVKLSRDQDVDDFSLDDLPEGMQSESNIIISRMGTMLEDMTVDNVMSAASLANAEQTIATIHTFDGLLITITSAEIDGTNYSSFGFAVDEGMVNDAAHATGKEDAAASKDKPDPAKEAETLNKLTSGWVYAIPAFKYELFTNKLEKLSKKVMSAETSSNAVKSKDN